MFVKQLLNVNINKNEINYLQQLAYHMLATHLIVDRKYSRYR